MAASFLIELLKTKLLPAGNVSASNSSIAVGGHVNAPVTLTQHVTANLTEANVQQLADGLYQRFHEATIPGSQLPSDQTVRADSEKQLDSQIDAIRDYIGKKPSFALDLLEKLYVSVASTASGRIRFRIQANIGICHHFLGNDEKAATCLCDAYFQAPEEPKAIANNVLGLMLRGEAAAAFKFGTEQIKAHPENETLAGYLVQCATYIPDVTAPLESVPPEHRNSPEVLTAYIHYLQKRGTDEQWWAVAWKGAAAHKDNEALHYYAAEATLSEVSRDPQLMRTNALSAAQRERLTPAAAVLAARWQQALKTDEKMRPDQAATGHNLLTAYFLLHDAAAIREFAQTALANGFCPPEVLEHIGRLAASIGDVRLAKTALGRVGDSPMTAFLKFHLASTADDWPTIAATSEETISRFPEVEQDWCRVLAATAAYEAQGASLTEEGLRALVPLARESKRAHVILARKARSAGFKSLSTAEYDRACSLVTPASEYAGRTMVARESARRHDWDRVVSILDGYVPTDENSEELDMLALAFANISPPRERGLQFFDELDVDLLKRHRYALFAGTLHYNRGDLDKAEAHFVQALSADAGSLDCILALAQTYLRAEKEDSAHALLAEVDIATVHGSPLDKMHLAQLLATLGRPQDALTLGYRVLCSASDNGKVNLAYVGLVLDIDHRLMPSPDIIGPGCWFEVENQHKEVMAATIDDGEPDYRQERLAANNPLATGAFGLKVGESFSVDRGVGPAHEWTVRKILSKHVRAWQDIMGNYEHRFPNQPGLWAVNVGKGGDDISVLLDMIKNQAERDRNSLDQYIENHLPLAVLAPMLRLDVMSLAGRVRHSGNAIISNTGRVVDLNSEIRKLTAGGFEVAVLDTYTAWIVTCSGLLPLLTRVFPHLAVPRSAVDQLLELHSDFNNNPNTDRMSLWWAEGQFYRDTFTPMQWQEQGRLIRARIDELCNACEVLPVAWKDKPSELVQQIMEGARSSHIWDAANLATSEKRLLVSEDLFYRQWAELGFPGIRHSWLQAIFKYAVEEKIVTRAEYARALVALASSKHEYLSVDSQTLEAAFMADQTDSLSEFSLLASSIGGKTPDWASHVTVTINFLRRVSDHVAVLDRRTLLAMNLMATNLLRYAGNRWPEIYVALVIHPDGNATTRTVLEAWRTGHLLPREPVEAVLAAVRHR